MKLIGGLFVIILSVAVLGCQATQSIASKSMQDGLKHQKTVFVNLSDKFAQTILNYGADKAVRAAESQDTEAAQDAIKYVFDEMQDLQHLHVQWERGGALLDIAQDYIWSQRPFWRILKEEWEEASQEVETSK